MTGLIILATFMAVIVVAFATVVQRKLPDTIILFMGVSLGAVVLFFVMQAPDVALTEAVIGAGTSSLIFLIALKQFKERV
jgi:multicomponent Na+:H+ antiporter subunit B